MGKRCKHPTASIERSKVEPDLVTAICRDCGLVWYGRLTPWKSTHPCCRLHKPPKWVSVLAEKESPQ